MEPPSRQLVDVLTRYGLAKPRDLRRCRPIVRRLARDLPTFDSIWIDALTQTRVITPFQGKLLESDDPDRLKVGPCVLVDEWQRDGRGTLFVARHRSSRRRCLLTDVSVPEEMRTKARDAVRDLISSLRGLSHSSVVVPQGCDELNGRLVVVSPYATGPTLQQLLVRRGRFPIVVVVEIARQLLEALTALEGRNVVHGDIRLSSIRLNSRGRTMLLNPGVFPAVGSRVSFHDVQPADAYDGIAPELISTGQTASFRSDMYAMGCLLWQLLAGRPPFPTGDPLSKLAAHQSRPIDDVRRWRPDVPDALAALIERMTRKDPDLRPSGPREVRDTVRLGLRTTRSRLASFYASFGAVAPRHGDSHQSAVRFPWPAAATCLVLLSGLSLGLLDAGARNELLRLADQWARPVTAETVGTAAVREPSGLMPLPGNPVDGVMELGSDGPYSAGSITTDRPLTIRAASGVMPTLVIGDQPLRITAQSLHISGVKFVAAGPEGDPTSQTSSVSAPVLLAVRSQTLSIDHCEFDRRLAEGQGSAVAWMVPDEADPSGGRGVARQCSFLGWTRALDLHAMPRTIGFDNCLKRGDGPLVRFASRNRQFPLRLHLRQTTLREAGGLLQWTAAAAEEAIQPTLLVVEDSVFALHDSSRGLLEFLSVAPVGWDRLLQITGEGSLVRPETPVAISPGGPIDDAHLRVEGLLIDAFEFAAADESIPASAVVATQAPRSTPTPPGIDPAGFGIPASHPPVVRQTSHEYNGK